MYTKTKKNLELAAKLKAESANWVGYNSNLVDEVTKEFTQVSLDSDPDHVEKIKTALSWFFGIGSIVVALLAFGTFIWRDAWKDKKSQEIRSIIEKEVSSKYNAVTNGVIFEKEGILYIRKE